MRPSETSRGVGYGLGALLRRALERDKREPWPERRGDELEPPEPAPELVSTALQILVVGIFIGFTTGFLLAMVIWL